MKLDEGTLDGAVEKGGVRVDRKCHWLKFKTFSGKVNIDLLFACAFGKACSVNDKEFSEDLTGCFVGRSIDANLCVRTQLNEVHDWEDMVCNLN